MWCKRATFVLFACCISSAGAFVPDGVISEILRSKSAVSGMGARHGRHLNPGHSSNLCPRSAAPQGRGILLCSALSGANGSGRKRVVVVGGTGRVGGSTARWLLEFGDEQGVPVDVVLAGRSRKNFDTGSARILRKLGGRFDEDRLSYAQVDFTDEQQLLSVLEGADLVVHTAGPFQGLSQPRILDAALAAGVPYVDVCDEKLLCKAAKDRSQSATVPAIVSAGIWPGSSALLAAACVDALAQENVQCEELEMSFYTAGTGNAGATIVAATFLLLVEPVLCFVNGKASKEPAWSGARDADFGGNVGERTVWLLDNPDVYTIYEALKVPNITSRFATAPMAWNYLFGALLLLPASLLGDKVFGRALAEFSDPIIRVVDALVGATNAMRIDARGGGRQVTARVTHDNLENCVGIATAAFAMEILLDRVPPGVHFPPSLWKRNGAAILERVRRDAVQWEVPGMP